jgi:hypothetical protein
MAMKRTVEHAEPSLGIQISVSGPPDWVWELIGDPPIERSCHHGFDIRCATTGGHGVASVRLPGARSLGREQLETRVHELYDVLCDELERVSTPHLLRVWNFVPGILEPLDDLRHRYMAFNAGRFAAYENRFHGVDSFGQVVPTASGVGHTGDDLWVHALAGAVPGQPVENPRQIPAYRYSATHGPLPPCFARATIVMTPTSSRLLVGGTASISGEHTCHIGDLAAQARETLTNLAALIGAGLVVAGEGVSVVTEIERLALFEHLRVYYVRPEDRDEVVRLVGEALPDDCRVEFARADLCRDGLLVEVEGVARMADRSS